MTCVKDYWLRHVSNSKTVVGTIVLLLELPVAVEKVVVQGCFEGLAEQESSVGIEVDFARGHDLNCDPNHDPDHGVRDRGKKRC